MNPEQSLATRADVRLCYRVLLGRAPENEEVVEDQLKAAPTVLDLLRRISGSQEFLDRVHLLGDCPARICRQGKRYAGQKNAFISRH